MREAIGGSFLIRIVLIFVVFLIIFLAFLFSYARIYKIKNMLINRIEQYEGYYTAEDFEEFLNKNSYNLGTKELPRYKYTCEAVKRNKDSIRGYRFKVVLYATFQLPFFESITTWNIEVKGETKIIIIPEFPDLGIDKCTNT